LLHFPLAQRFCATGAEIIIEFFAWQNQQQTLAHRHGTTALLTIEGGSPEIFELAHLIVWNELGFAFAPTHNVGNNRMQDHNRRFSSVNVDNKAIAIVVKERL